jgi:hypothetical protein
LVIFGLDYCFLALENKSDGVHLLYSVCKAADKGSEETIQADVPYT